MEDDDCCVKVAVNIRPLIDIELAAGCQEALYVPPGEPQVRSFRHAAAPGHAAALLMPELLVAGVCGPALLHL
jgi:hypothetical protein